MTLWLAEFDDGLFLQRGGRAGLHAGAAADAFAVHEGLVLAGRDPTVEAAATDRQCKGALRFLAGAHAAVADDALARVVGEVGVGLVLDGVAVVGARGGTDAIAHIAQAGHAGHVLQLAVAVGAAGQAVQRVVADVELHHALAQVLQLRRLGVHHHAVFGRRRARGRIALAAFDLDQAQPTGTERLQAVGGAQLGHVDAGIDRRAHQRRALGHADGITIDVQRDGLGRQTRRCAAVDVGLKVLQHGRGPHAACWSGTVMPKSAG
jgi:hypothetical protein